MEVCYKTGMNEMRKLLAIGLSVASVGVLFLPCRSIAGTTFARDALMPCVEKRGVAGDETMQMDGQCCVAAAVLEMMAHEANDRVEYVKGCPEL